MSLETGKKVGTMAPCRLERLLLVFGMALLAFYSARQVRGSELARTALQRFGASEQPTPADPPDTAGVPWRPTRPDFSLWAKKRIREYRESLRQHFVVPPVAVLRIPKIRLEAPVWEGTDDDTLNRGVGWIEGTARIQENGNVAIAGHRDGFFRGLKDLEVGDRMDLVTPTQAYTYVVNQFQVVVPNDLSVLRPTSTPTLTLVTCYPFYFVGSAPQRFIVHASLTGSRQLKTGNDRGSLSFATSQ